MKSLKHLTVIIALFFFLSCNNDDNNNGNEPSSIKIGSYIFNFETEFTLEELQGIVVNDLLINNFPSHFQFFFCIHS